MKYLIVGLGNIGPEYQNTRHNIGFKVLDAFAKASNAVFEDMRYGAVATVKLKGRTLILLKPNTYMNLSGKAVSYWMQKEKIELSNLFVVVDDLALPFGTIRLRGKGSDGGHNGLKNIIQHLGKDQFVRIKVGVGEKPAGYDLADYVLGHFDREEQVLMKQVSEEVCEAVQMILEKGPDAAMNVYNGRKVEKA